MYVVPNMFSFFHVLLIVSNSFLLMHPFKSSYMIEERTNITVKKKPNVCIYKEIIYSNVYIADVKTRTKNVK